MTKRERNYSKALRPPTGELHPYLKRLRARGEFSPVEPKVVATKPKDCPECHAADSMSTDHSGDGHYFCLECGASWTVTEWEGRK